MSVISLLGSLGTLIGYPAPFHNSCGLCAHEFGVSLDTAATSSIVSFGWAAYGMMTGQPYVSFCHRFVPSLR